MIKTVFQSVCSLSKQNSISSLVPWRFVLTRRFCDIDPTATSKGDTKSDTSQLVKPPKQRKEEEARKFLENMDEEMKQKKAMIEIEYEMLKATTLQVPETITDYNWKILLTETKSMSARRKFFYFLHKTELKAMRDKEKKIEKAEQRIKNFDAEKQFQHSIFVRERDFYLKKLNGVRSMIQGSPIVFDMDYKQSTRELTRAQSQFKLCYGVNMLHAEPFHIHVTGLESAPDFLAETEHGGEYEHLFADFHSCSFMDLFPKERLVYLSPNGPMLTDYNGDDVFVIGGLVDLLDTSPRSRTKAKELGIRSGSFPLKKYMMLKRNTILTLDCVFKIMLDVNLNHDWRGALHRHLPNRRYEHENELSVRREAEVRKRFFVAQKEYTRK